MIVVIAIGVIIVIVAGRCGDVASILLFIDVMDLLVEVNTGCISPAMLADAMAKHYAAHVIAYGYTIFVPKHHFMLHIPKQLERFKFLVACWVHERKYKIIKRWAVPMCIAKQRDYERSLLAHGPTCNR